MKWSPDAPHNDLPPLNILFLIEKGLLSLPILYLSRYILQHRSDYYRLLTSVTRDQQWEEWIKKLVDIGVLKEIARGKEKLFVHPKLVQLMTTDSNHFTAYQRQ